MPDVQGWTPVAETSPPEAVPTSGWTPVDGAKPDFKAENEPPSAAMRAASEFYDKSPLAAAASALVGGEYAHGRTEGPIGGVAGAVYHPLDTYFGLKPAAETVKSLAKAQWDEALKAAAKAKETLHGGGTLSASEALGHGLAAILPILGPAAADVGEHFGKGDIAGGAGGAAGLLLPFAAKYGLELKNAADPRGADLLRREAEQKVSQRVLAPGNIAYKGTAEQIAPEVLARKMTGNRLELQQAADEGMAKAGDQIDAVMKNYSQSGPFAVETKPITDAIQQSIDKLTVKGKPVPTAATRVQHLTGLQDYIKGLGKQVPFEDLQKVRDDFYRAADAAKGYQGRNPAMEDVGWAAREAGSAIRQAFANERPELAGPNADYTFYKRLGDVLDPSLGRPKNVSYAPTGVTGGLSTAGAVIGHAMSNVPVVRGMAALVASRILPALKEAENSPAWQLIGAKKKMAIADAIEKGQIGSAQMQLLSIAKSTPRTQTADQTPEIK